MLLLVYMLYDVVSVTSPYTQKAHTLIKECGLCVSSDGVTLAETIRVAFTVCGTRAARVQDRTFFCDVETVRAVVRQLCVTFESENNRYAVLVRTRNPCLRATVTTVSDDVLLNSPARTYDAQTTVPMKLVCC